MIIKLTSFNLMHIDATLESMGLFWRMHPKPYVPFIKNPEHRKRLSEKHDVVFDDIDDPTQDKIILNGLRIFTNPVVLSESFAMDTHLDITPQMMGDTENIIDVVALSKQHKYHTEYYNGSCPIFSHAKEGRHKYFYNTQSLVCIRDDSYVEKSNELYMEGLRVNVDKYMFNIYDSPTVTEVISYKWRK